MSINKINSLFFLLLILSLLISCGEQLQQENDATDNNFTSSLKYITDPTQDGYIMRSTAGSRVAGAIGVLGGHTILRPNHVRGARIYDNFNTELGGDTSVTTPAVLNPLLAIATFTNKYPGRAAPSIPDSYRCAQCHDFDYEGGIYSFNRGSTDNLLELMKLRNRTEEDVYSILTNGFMVYDGTNPVDVHSYTGILTEQAIVDVADFVTNEIFNTHEYVMATSDASTALSMVAGMALYNAPLTGTPTDPPSAIRIDGIGFNCEECHGINGKLATYGDGTPLSLFNEAWETPFEFLHRTLFGSPRDLSVFPNFTRDVTVMPGLYEVIETDGLFIAGKKEGSELMSHIQSDMFPIQ